MVDFSNVGVIVSLSVSSVFFIVIDFLIARVTKKKRYAVLSFLIEGCIIASYIFNQYFLLLTFSSLLLVVYIMLASFFFKNVRDFFGKPFDKAFEKSKSPIKGELIYDHDAVLDIIEEAAISMSKQKIGALITFQKNDSLAEFEKSGTKINAPLSAELLETIFYTGSRLHDGAVIVRGSMIDSASVYFTPTTKPLSGKLGSRHRAAIGISEVSDSITLVISEETGRISIAQDGQLEHVTQDTFIKRLSELL